MTARVLAPTSYAGVDISQSADLIRAHFDAVGTNLLPPQYDQRLARVAGGWPRPLDPQPLERTLELQVRLMIAYDGTADDDLQEFKRVFSPRKGQQTLVATDGTNDWELEASVLRMAHQNGVLDTWVVTLQAADGLWRKTTDSIQPTTISGAITAAIDATTIGNELAPAVIAVTPASIKGQGNDQRYRSQQTVAWRAARGAARYPIALTLDTATEVTAGRMLGTGDDLRVLVDGREVDRWPGSMNTGSTKVWIVQDFSPARTGALRAAITAGAPATGGNLELEDAGDLPSTGTAVWGTEAISWLMKSSDGRTLLGITRSVRGTTAASHAAGDVGYLVTRQVDLVWGYSGAVAPVRDADTEPIFELDDSSNELWSFEEFATVRGQRPAEWGSARYGTNELMIAARGYWDDYTYKPRADGAEGASWAATGAASRYECVDEFSPDEDTTYLSTATALASVTFIPTVGGALPGASESGLITEVRVKARARFVGGTGATLFPALRTDGAMRTVGSTALTASYADYSQAWTTNPVTGGAWTLRDVLALEFGVRAGTLSGGSVVRVTRVYLEITAVLGTDPATEVSAYVRGSSAPSGYLNADAWHLATPVGVGGPEGAVVTVLSGEVSGARDGSLYGTDAFGQFVRVAATTSSAGGQVNTMIARPDGPLYDVAFHLPTLSTTIGAGAAMRTAVLNFDPDATPLIVQGAREDTYIARFTLENVTTEQAITVLYPMAIGSTLTIDADAGTVEYSLPSYNPLPALSLDAPRIPWLELEAGENDLVWDDPSNGAAGLGLSLRWQDRRS